MTIATVDPAVASSSPVPAGLTTGPPTVEIIPTDLRPALVALTRGRTAAVRLDRAADAMGMPEDEAAVVLVELQALSLISIWQRGPGKRPCVVVSARGAALLGLELSDRTTTGFELYWIRKGRGNDPGPKPSGVLAEVDVAPDPDRPNFLDSLPDLRAVDPARAAEAGDVGAESRKAENGAIRMGVALPRPTLILGITAT